MKTSLTKFLLCVIAAITFNAISSSASAQSYNSEFMNPEFRSYVESIVYKYSIIDTTFTDEYMDEIANTIENCSNAYFTYAHKRIYNGFLALDNNNLGLAKELYEYPSKNSYSHKTMYSLVKIFEAQVEKSESFMYKYNPLIESIKESEGSYKLYRRLLKKEITRYKQEHSITDDNE